MREMMSVFIIVAKEEIQLSDDDELISETSNLILISLFLLRPRKLYFEKE